MAARTTERSLSLFGDEPLSRALGQWFTPKWLVERMTLAANVRGRLVLEPSAGDGRFVDEALKHGARHVVAVELDAELAAALKARFGENPRVTVVWGDYLSAEMRLTLERLIYQLTPAGGRAFDLALGNPPYDDGLDGRFCAELHNEAIEHMLLCRLQLLETRDRADGYWKRRWVRLLAICEDRQAFEGDGSGKASFCSAAFYTRTWDPGVHPYPWGDTIMQWWKES